MALVVICGLPAAGKSTIASMIAEQLRLRGPVTVIDEPSLHMELQTSYADATAEKRTRGQLKAAVDRALGKDKTVILDSLNSIKGYRYEIWCLARAAAIRYSLVYVDTVTDQARQWNSVRQSSYPTAVFEDLASRFEIPDNKNRWEQPLFRLKPEAAELPNLLQAVCSSLTSSGARNTSVHPAKPLEPTTATTNPSASRPNLLAELDQAAQAVIDAVTEAQAGASMSMGPVTVEVAGIAHPVRLQRQLTLPEMRRHKRAYMKLLTQNSYVRLQSADQGKQMFLDFLQSAMRN